MNNTTQTSQGGDDNEPMAAFMHKMRQADMPQAVVDLFSEYLSQLLGSSSVGRIPEDEIAPVTEDDIKRQEELTPQDRELGESLLGQAAIIKLNGGLGTSMGMPYAKSLLTVKSKLTFLDVILKQAHSRTKQDDTGPSLVLMDSFNTHEDVQAYFDRLGVPRERRPLSFVQHMYPKILAENMQPAHRPDEPDLEWNPPGHGDLYAALHTSGMLDRLLGQGKRYALVSNADNLGAVLNPAILGYFVRQGLQFLMEVAERTPSDKKGGHLAKNREGHLLLREIAQCPDEDVQAFQDIQRHRYFNTNSIWLDLQELKNIIDSQGLPRLPLIVNPKHLDPRDESTPKVYQLETAMGAAIATFERSGALHVSRKRFAPVKKTNDLLVVRSDCYQFNPDYQLVPNPQRSLPPIEVDLDSTYYKQVDQFESRFPAGEPSLIDCSRLQVQGDVLFEGQVACRGEVSLRNETEQQQRIAQGTVLEGETVWEP